MVDANVKIRGGASDETGWVDDGTNVRLKTSTDKVGLGIATPVTPLDVFEDPTGIQDNTGGGGGAALKAKEKKLFKKNPIRKAIYAYGLVLVPSVFSLGSYLFLLGGGNG